MEKSVSTTPVAKNILLYGIGGVLSQAAGLITLPLIVRKLSTAEYGAIELITATTGYFALLIGLNTISGLYRYYYEADENEKAQRSLVSTTFLFVMLCALIVALMSVFLSPVFAMSLFADSAMTPHIQLAFIALIPVSIYIYAMGLMRLQNRALAYILISVTVALVYMGSVILLIGIRQIGIPGFFYSQILANTTGILLVFVISRRLFSLTFSKNWFVKVARYSFPLVPGTILAWSLSANNRIILNASTNPVQVAYYGLANKAAIVITLMTQAFCYAWEPTMYALLKQTEKIRRILPQVLSIYMFGCLSLSIMMMTTAREIFLILAPPEYLAGISLLGMIQLRWVFTMGVYVIDPGTAKTGKTWWVTIVLAAAVLVNLTANTILTPRLGLTGAVLSELIGYGAAMVGRWLISDRLFPVNWHRGYFVSTVALYLLFATVQTRIIMSNNIPAGISFLIRLISALIFITLSWFLMDRTSRQTILSEIHSFSAKVFQKRSR